MKIMLLNPPFTEYGDGVKGYGGKSTPLNLAYLAAFLIEKGYTNTRILDAEAHELNYETILKNIKKFDPDIVGITSPTPSFQQAADLAKLMKRANPNLKIITGGPHSSALPEDSAKEDGIDFVCFGEGEHTMLEVVQAIEKGNNDFKDIDGIAYKKDNKKIVKNKPRQLIENLDALPFPARHLLPYKLYYPPPTKNVSDKNGTSMVTSRGCPFNCTYCVAKVIWTRKVRFRSTDNVVDEMEECVNKYNLGEFNLHDELFTASEKRVIDICKEIIKRKLDVAWVCMARVDTIHSREMLNYMKKAGCGKIVFGFESGSQKILDLMKKGTTLKQAENAVKIVKEIGIRCGGAFMLGNIGETRKTVRQTINFAKKINTDTISFFQTSPYPGTELYDIAKRDGLISKNVQWKDFSLISKNPPALNLPNLTKEEVARSLKKAYKEFYLRPTYIINQISGIHSKKDFQRILRGLSFLIRVQKQ